MIKNTINISIDAEHKSAEKVALELKDKIKKQEFVDTIVLIRVAGKLSSGRVHDINFKEIFEEIYKKGAYFVMKNTVKLTTEDFEEIKVEHGTPEEIEERVIKEHSGQIKVNFAKEEKKITNELMKALSREQDESEKKYEYEERVKDDASRVLELN